MVSLKPYLFMGVLVIPTPNTHPSVSVEEIWETLMNHPRKPKNLRQETVVYYKYCSETLYSLNLFREIVF